MRTTFCLQSCRPFCGATRLRVVHLPIAPEKPLMIARASVARQQLSNQQANNAVLSVINGKCKNMNALAAQNVFIRVNRQTGCGCHL